VRPVGSALKFSWSANVGTMSPCEELVAGGVDDNANYSVLSTAELYTP
jgi:hypothetical protein